MAKSLVLNVAADSHQLVHPNLHDGNLLAISTIDGKIELALVDVESQRFYIRLDDVVEFLATDFKQGNIILDMTLVQGKDVQAVDLELLNSSEYSADQEYLQNLHQRVVDQSLYVLQLNPSYGCQLIAIAGGISMESQ
jgi:hypothetical protein